MCGRGVLQFKSIISDSNALLTPPSLDYRQDVLHVGHYFTDLNVRLTGESKIWFSLATLMHLSANDFKAEGTRVAVLFGAVTEQRAGGGRD